ncbi:allantoate amidohydrolase [Alkalihalophilus pseudofirmus OF4]|uniref:Allantoate amidohydrolase n=1 Tax=Alkalihalophilus pseudofirmus (strain ATCC BAA-2126 / JCM 17055 / OF4) TaxID=398511 RepID=D3FSN9_ALKPO|nr:Zn-dependent hydrolase [Alkalihalophilus pseudofirmus]ADC50007.1 allantoate amidohydrolase [Alkalihalophilus pseudofirmus OF4]
MQTVFTDERLLEGVNQCAEYPHIDPATLANRILELAAFGKTADGGVTRFVYTEEERQAKELFISWIKEAGLEVREDGFGNLFAKYTGEDPDLPAVMTGSHLDSVPNGGYFDGPLGCISSFMAIEALMKEGKRPKRSIEFVIFVNEEGSRFNNGIFGSQALMGEITKEELNTYRDKEGVSIAEAMKEQGYDPETALSGKCEKSDIHAFLELHIEQGKQLELNNEKIGIVSGIAGPTWQSFTFLGETDHAGNTPMHLRKDTLCAAAEFMLEVEKLPRQINETAVATVGKIDVSPNGANVISGKTNVIVDVRDIDKGSLAELNKRIVSSATEIAERRGIQAEHEELTKIDPVVVPDSIQESIKASCERHQLPYRSLVSGAGHDAMIMGKYVPSAMVFVPSVNGKSHSPEEFTHLADCVDGVAVMKDVLWDLANE